MIDKELVDYYEARLAMMSEKGWKDLMSDLEGMIEARDRLSGVSTIEQLQFAKGELSIMNWLKTLMDVSEASYNQLKEGKNATL